MTDRQWDACHDELDWEDIEPEGPTLAGDVGNEVIHTFVRLLEHYAIPHTLEPGWETRNPSYNWYTGAPHGVMVHHTATSGYAPPRAYPEPEGDRDDGKTICNLLVQPDGTINVISADPANYSSGLNWKGVLDDYILARRRFHGPQSGPLGPEWYGNRAFVNIETVHEGTGGSMSEVQERAVIVAATLLVAIIGTDSTGVIGHYDGRGTKPDPHWNGDRYRVAYIQDQVQAILDADHLPTSGGDMPTHFKIGMTDRFYEEVVWLIFQAAGGVVHPNDNSSQVQSRMPWKSDVKHVNVEDFTLLAEILGLNEHETERLMEDGLNATGKELAALRALVYG